jgi:hypothetical protein
VAARLGGGLNAMGNAIGYSDTLLARADTLFGQSLEQVNSRALNGNDIDCILGNGFAKEEFGHPIDGISLGWICSPAQLSNRICNSHNNVLE